MLLRSRVILVLLAMSLASSNVHAIDPNCELSWCSGDDASYCNGCNLPAPPGVYKSSSVYKREDVLLCRRGGHACTVQPQFAPGAEKSEVSEAQCPAQTSQGEHLADALLFGIDVDAGREHVLRLADVAPELGLFLLTMRLEKGEIPAIDQKNNQAFTSVLPSAELVRAALDRKGDEALSKQKVSSVGEGVSIALESRATILPNDKVQLDLSSRAISSETKALLSKIHSATIVLSKKTRSRSKVAYFEQFDGDVYRIESVVAGGEDE